MARSRLLLAFGGRSGEHDISIRSATEVLGAIDRDRFDPVLLGITRDGQWRTGPTSMGPAQVLAQGEPLRDLLALDLDVVFPVLHGPFGEDGTFQGLLEVLDLPYVGSGVLASALCMDKVAQKHYVAAAAPSIPLVPWREVQAHGLQDPPTADRIAEEIGDALGFPCFIKPANMGSSVGVSAAHSPQDLLPALREAARYDTRIVVEKGVDAREIEVAILGNGGPDTLASAPGEIGLPPGTWYDYETKYEKDVATTIVPADLEPAVAQTVRDHALAAFRACDCRGLARVDFLLERGTQTPYLNELNTMPGFTTISMYPKLMGHAGIPYGELVTRLCELGVAHHASRANLSTER